MRGSHKAIPVEQGIETNTPLCGQLWHQVGLGLSPNVPELQQELR